MKIKVTKKGAAAFAYYSQCEDTKTLDPWPFSEDGNSAEECFFWRETNGLTVSCREPDLIHRAVNGKAWHGVTVKMLAEDFAIHRLITSAEIKQSYPLWVAAEIFKQAGKVSMEQIGFIPKFVMNRADFSELALPIKAE